MQAILYTVLALVAFAGNSVLCRLALGQGSIDAGSFTVVRLLSGIVVLLLLLQMTKKRSPNNAAKGSWRAACYLFIYAVAFSFAYLSLDTGVGALILFGAVQITMIGMGLLAGDRLTPWNTVGVLLSFSGFVYLVLPDLTTPTFKGFVLMAVAGIAWGFYSLAGKGASNPLADTAYNFLRTLPLVIVLLIASIPWSVLTLHGVILAMLSGAITSGIGYALWYAALAYLSAMQAAVLQLSVPVIAACGGILFSAEIIGVRFMMASLLILGGILLVILSRYPSLNKKTFARKS